jgi:hypothetical protein
VPVGLDPDNYCGPPTPRLFADSTDVAENATIGTNVGKFEAFEASPGVLQYFVQGVQLAEESATGERARKAPPVPELTIDETTGIVQTAGDLSGFGGSTFKVSVFSTLRYGLLQTTSVSADMEVTITAVAGVIGASKTSGGGVAGIVAGLLIALIIAALLIWWFCCRKEEEEDDQIAAEEARRNTTEMVANPMHAQKVAQKQRIGNSGATFFGADGGTGGDDVSPSVALAKKQGKAQQAAQVQAKQPRKGQTAKAAANTSSVYDVAGGGTRIVGFCSTEIVVLEEAIGSHACFGLKPVCVRSHGIPLKSLSPSHTYFFPCLASQH